MINQAAFVANNIIKGDATAIHYDEIDNLTEDQILLDVRNPGELSLLVILKGQSTFRLISCAIVWVNYQKTKRL